MHYRNTNRVKLLIGIAPLMLIMISLDQAIAFNNPPVRCEGLGALQSISLAEWESGLGAWTVGTRELAADFDTPDWAVVGSLPDGRSGKAAFVADQDDFQVCETPTQQNKSGVLMLDSPPIVIPAGALVPRISVDHWWAIEKDWDGGNFKISVNSSAFIMIPASAIEVGPYNMTLFPALTEEGAEFNTNPLAGQDAFSGPILSWGQSHINLLGIAAPGDTVQLRFDFGIDECGGDIGWYVDNVEFYSCANEFPPSDTSLTLVKQLINNEGGTATGSAWTLSATGPTGFSGAGPSVSSGSGFAPGTYDLAESGPTGYSATDWVCTGGTLVDGNTVTLALDEVATCSIRNDDIAPTLKVVKNITNDNGGTVTKPNDFGLKVDGNTVLHNVTNAFDAGNHTVSEDGLAGYQAGSWGGDCNSNGAITLAPGQVATCTITNNDIAPTIKVINTVTSDNGGTVNDPNAFGLKVDGGVVLDSVINTFTAGPHNVSATGVAGYQASVWGGACANNGSITLTLGQNAVCSISHDDIPPTLKVVKTIIRDNGGTVTDPNAFGLKVDGSAVLHNAINNFDAGNHTVSEDGLPDYTPGKWGGDCNPDGGITLVLDQDATCSITNNDIDPNEVIFKDGFE